MTPYQKHQKVIGRLMNYNIPECHIERARLDVEYETWLESIVRNAIKKYYGV